jgi:hypothetical protein
LKSAINVSLQELWMSITVVYSSSFLSCWSLLHWTCDEVDNQTSINLHSSIVWFVNNKRVLLNDLCIYTTVTSMLDCMLTKFTDIVRWWETNVSNAHIHIWRNQSLFYSIHSSFELTDGYFLHFSQAIKHDKTMVSMCFTVAVWLI